MDLPEVKESCGYLEIVPKSQKTYLSNLKAMALLPFPSIPSHWFYPGLDLINDTWKQVNIEIPDGDSFLARRYNARERCDLVYA